MLWVYISIYIWDLLEKTDRAIYRKISSKPTHPLYNLLLTLWLKSCSTIGIGLNGDHFTVVDLVP